MMVQADAKTNRFRDRVLRKGGIWRDIYGIDEKKVASMVREDKVDILVELTGHTANNKLGMLACKPAPVQVCEGYTSLLIILIINTFVISHYVFALGVARFLSCAHWVLQVCAWL